MSVGTSSICTNNIMQAKTLCPTSRAIWPHGRHTAQEGNTFCLLEMNAPWHKQCKTIPHLRTLSRCWSKSVQTYRFFSVKQILCPMTMVCNCILGQRSNNSSIMTIIMFRGKKSTIPTEKQTRGYKHHIVGVPCCRRDRKIYFNIWSNISAKKLKLD